jgi:predicted RNase H-like nuclease (RuvC/YqgF family)
MSDLVEVFRKALMEVHADDWDMDTVSEAAHICALSALAARQAFCRAEEADAAVPATPEGGELEDLLARADRGTAGLSSKRIAALVADLASALRRQRDGLVDERNENEFNRQGKWQVTTELDRARSDVKRLEREIAEARDTREVVWTGTVSELKNARGDIQIQRHTRHVKAMDLVVVLRATAEGDSK